MKVYIRENDTILNTYTISWFSLFLFPDCSGASFLFGCWISIWQSHSSGENQGLFAMSLISSALLFIVHNVVFTHLIFWILFMALCLYISWFAASWWTIHCNKANSGGWKLLLPKFYVLLPGNVTRLENNINFLWNLCLLCKRAWVTR